MPETRSFFVSSEDLVIGFPMRESIVINLNLTNYSKKKKLLIEEAILNHQTTFEKSETVTAVKLMNSSKVVVAE